MSRIRVASFAISLDGYGAGSEQSLENPLGRGGERLHDWAFATGTFQQRVMGREGGSTGVDDSFIARGFENVGAWIMGRHMFAPTRGAWRDDGWKGWWGDDPPFRCPVFVLTHHPREPLEMRGGTVFRFVTGGLHEAVGLARQAAGGQDIRVGGGVATVREFLRERLIDEMHLAIAPVLLGSGEHLLEGLDLPGLGYAPIEHVPSPAATHVVFRPV